MSRLEVLEKIAEAARELINFHTMDTTCGRCYGTESNHIERLEHWFEHLEEIEGRT